MMKHPASECHVTSNWQVYLQMEAEQCAHSNVHFSGIYSENRSVEVINCQQCYEYYT